MHQPQNSTCSQLISQTLCVNIRGNRGGGRGELRGYNSPSCKVCKELELNTTELPYVKTYLFQTFPIQQAS